MRVPSSDPIRLLLVEDSQVDHCLLSDLLDAVADATFTIDWAKDLATGRDRLKHGHFDLGLINPELPDGDGLQLLETEAIRGFPVPMIVLCDHGSISLDQRAMTLGASGFLDKNWLDPTLLERTIRYAMHQRKLARSLAQSTLLDESTGLITPTLFRDRLARAMAFTDRHQGLLAVVLIDIDQEAVSDLDPDLGEQQMAIQAKRLIHHLRKTDTMARMADRQMALILEGLRDAESAALVAQKVLERLTTPIIQAGRTVIPRPSLGIALYPDDCSDADTLLRQAEAAMRLAGAEKDHRYRFSSARVDRKVQRQGLLSNDLRRALDQETLMLRYRPLIHVTDMAISLSAEVYANRPGDVPISMEEFLSIADDRSLIEAAMDRIVRAGVSQLLAWRDAGFASVELALPFISSRASDLPFLERSIRSHLGKAPINPDQIEIDLDQHLVFSDLAHGGHGLTMLKKTGVRLALDELGRHEASIEHLATGLLDSLKLSRRLYRDLPGDTAREICSKRSSALGTISIFASWLMVPAMSSSSAFSRRQAAMPS